MLILKFQCLRRKSHFFFKTKRRGNQILPICTSSYFQLQQFFPSVLLFHFICLCMIKCMIEMTGVLKISTERTEESLLQNKMGQRWLSDQQHWLLFQMTQIRSLSGDSSMMSDSSSRASDVSSTCRHFPHVQMPTCKHKYLHIIKSKNKMFLKNK